MKAKDLKVGECFQWGRVNIYYSVLHLGSEYGIDGRLFVADTGGRQISFAGTEEVIRVSQAKFLKYEKMSQPHTFREKT